MKLFILMIRKVRMSYIRESQLRIYWITIFRIATSLFGPVIFTIYNPFLLFVKSIVDSVFWMDFCSTIWPNRFWTAICVMFHCGCAICLLASRRCAMCDCRFTINYLTKLWRWYIIDFSRSSMLILVAVLSQWIFKHADEKWSLRVFKGCRQPVKGVLSSWTPACRRSASEGSYRLLKSPGDFISACDWPTIHYPRPTTIWD